VKHFKKIPILDDQQWQETFLYIHLNPVKHGFVKNPDDWKWSSHSSYQNPEKQSSLERGFYLNFFDDYRHCTEIMELKKEWLLNKKEE
jgi:hypothetical protein